MDHTQKNGLECFDPETEIFHHIGFKFSDQAVNELAFPRFFKTNDGKLWISTFKSLIGIDGVNERDLKSLHFETFQLGKNMPTLMGYTYPFVSPSGEIIVSTSKAKIKSYDPSKNTWEDFHLPNILDETQSTIVFNNVDNNDFLWLYCQGRLQAFRNKQLVHDFPIKLNFDGIHHFNKNFIHKDKLGNIWLIFKSQLLKITGRNLGNETLNPQIVIEEAICEFMHVAKNGDLWIGTTGYGLRLIKPDKAEFEHWLPNKSVMAIDKFEDSIYILNKISAFNNKGEMLEDEFFGRALANDNTSFILEDDDKFRTLTIRKKSKEHTIDIPYLEDAFPYLDKENNYWIAFKNNKIGVKWNDRDTLEYHDYSFLWQGPDPCIVNTIYESKDGTLWLSSTLGLIQVSINRADQKIKFQKWTGNKESKLSSNTILCAVDDPYESDQYIWLGTKGGGINKMNKKTGLCSHFTKEDGLPNDVVYGILPDEFGHLWLSTNFGLSQFNIKNKHFRNFTAKDDGLQADEFNTSSFFKLEDGRLAFGGVNGISVFDPKDFLPDTSFANIVFTKLKVNNKEVVFGDSIDILKKPLNFTKEIKLDHDQNFLSLSYAGIGGEEFGKNNYYYKVDGVDSDWVFAGKNTDITYPNLAAGTYRFMVADVSQSGKRNPNPKIITFKITSPWWRSNLAYLMYAIFIGSLIYLFFRFRLNRSKMQQGLEFKKKETEQMKALDELKTKFFSNITHEFRTPLTLVKEPARQLLKHEDEQVKQQSAVIFNNANRLLLLVNQLMDVAKLEDDKMKINKFHGDILIVLKEIFGYFLPLTQRKAQNLIWDCDLVELKTESDKQIIEKILYNLLSNAQKFTPEGGSIRLKVLARNKVSWQLIVEDSGIGIDAKDQLRIYDRFYQTDASTTRQGEGTGIGLALVKELVELMEGEIKVESELGKGTTFTLSFPLSFEHIESPELVKETAPASLIQEILAPVSVEDGLDKNDLEPKDAIEILVVEDNDEMREFIKGILVKNRYKVYEASNGEIGIQLAKQYIPDLIISDVMMPKIDGLELLSVVKKDPLTSHIPIVLLTAKVRLKSKIEGYDRGADAYLEKPFNTEELLARLKQLLDFRKQLQLRFQQTSNVPKEKLPMERKGEKAILKLSKIDQMWIDNLQKIIKNKLGSNSFTVDELTVELLMSRTQFYSKVKALTGLTPAVLIRDIRLDMVYEMVLSKPDAKFSEVANSLGMADIQYFRKLFKKRFGKSPKDLIKSI